MTRLREPSSCILPVVRRAHKHPDALSSRRQQRSTIACARRMPPRSCRSTKRPRCLISTSRRGAACRQGRSCTPGRRCNAPCAFRAHADGALSSPRKRRRQSRRSAHGAESHQGPQISGRRRSPAPASSGAWPQAGKPDALQGLRRPLLPPNCSGDGHNVDAVCLRSCQDADCCRSNGSPPNEKKTNEVVD